MKPTRTFIVGVILFTLTLALFESPGPTIAAATITTIAMAVILVDPAGKTARVIALTLAAWTHGPVAGKKSDRCYPARADHFLTWIRTGTNDPTATPDDLDAYANMLDADDDPRSAAAVRRAAATLRDKGTLT